MKRKTIDPKAFDDTTVLHAHRKRGAKSTYDPKYAKMAEMLCARGAIDTELADAFGVTSKTINAWKILHPDFLAALKHGKASIFDPKVERALALRAIGYEVDTEEIKVTKDGEVLRIPVRKHFPPDTTACIFWLKNRQPQQWRDVWNIQHEEVDKRTAAELFEEIKKEAADLGLLQTVPQPPTGVAPPGTNGKTKH